MVEAVNFNAWYVNMSLQVSGLCEDDGSGLPMVKISGFYDPVSIKSWEECSLN